MVKVTLSLPLKTGKYIEEVKSMVKTAKWQTLTIITSREEKSKRLIKRTQKDAVTQRTKKST